MPASVPSEWTQVDLLGRRGAAGQKVIAGVLALIGIAGGGLAFLLAPEWWAIALILLACVFTVLIGVSLWFSASSGSEEAVRMLAGGRRVELRVRWILDTSDDAVSYRFGLRLPVRADEKVIVEHWCRDARCIEAAQGFPGSSIPAMVDESRRAWGVVHGPIDR